MGDFSQDWIANWWVYREGGIAFEVHGDGDERSIKSVLYRLSFFWERKRSVSDVAGFNKFVIYVSELKLNHGEN